MNSRNVKDTIQNVNRTALFNRMPSTIIFLKIILHFFPIPCIWRGLISPGRGDHLSRKMNRIYRRDLEAFCLKVLIKADMNAEDAAING